jgi:hypothetical protein
MSFVDIGRNYCSIDSTVLSTPSWYVPTTAVNRTPFFVKSSTEKKDQN